MPTLSSSAELNRERVFKACNELYAQGTKPTVRLLQSMIDEISSTSTIHVYFSEWKKELEAREKSLIDRLGFSTEFIQSFSREINRFSVETEQRHKVRADEALAQLDAALTQMIELEEKLDAQRAMNDAQEKEIDNLRRDIKSTEQQYVSRIKEIETATSNTVDELRRQLNEMKSENAALVRTSENLRTELAKSELKLETQLTFVNDTKAQHAANQTEITNLRKALSDSERALSAAKAEAGANQKIVSSVEQRLEATGALITELRVRADRAEKANTQLEQSLKEAHAVTEGLREERTQLKSTLDEQRKVITKLTTTKGF